MKTQILLFCFLCMFTWSIQAQVQQRKAAFHSGPEKAGFSVNRPQPGFKPNHMVVPEKRNRFNPSTSVWKWDTIMCCDTSSEKIPAQRVSRRFNSIGDSLIQLTEHRQGELMFENYARETFTYDSVGNCLTYLAERWQNNAWVNSEKREYAYNANGDPLDWKREMWQSNAWVNFYHYAWHYNANGLYDTCLYQVGQGSLWVNNILWIPAYNGNGYILSDSAKNWINNNWEFSYHETYTNDSNGNHLTGLRQDWVNSSWLNSLYYFWTWDAAGNCLSTLRQEWQSNAWVNADLRTNTYDGNENIIIFLDQNWFNGNWVNNYQSLYVYDTSNNMLSWTQQNWNNSTWLNVAMDQYTYDSMGNSLTGKLLMWQLNGWIPYVGSPQVFADHQPDYTVNLLGVYRYYTIIDSILVFKEPTPAPLRVSLFPNPAYSKLYVSLPRASIEPSISMAIYDLYGQLVLSKKLVYETTDLDISGLKPSVYFVRFSNNRMTRVLKFIKE